MALQTTDKTTEAAGSTSARFLIPREELRTPVDTYDRDKITICALGSHSALGILDGSKDEGFRARGRRNAVEVKEADAMGSLSKVATWGARTVGENLIVIMDFIGVVERPLASD
ncbi:MAG: hypothetical protein ABSB29_07715 [Nitrososphaerales archaeon]